MLGRANCEFYLYYFKWENTFHLIYIGEGLLDRCISHKNDALVKFILSIDPDNIYIIRYSNLTKKFGEYCEAATLAYFRLNEFNFTAIGTNYIFNENTLINKVSRNKTNDVEILRDIDKNLVSRILTINNNILNASN